MRIKIYGRRAVMLSLVVSLVAGTASNADADNNAFYFCDAKVDERKTYYVTSLFPGKLQVATSQMLRSYMVDALSLDADTLKVSCHSYKSDSSTGSGAAEKFRNSEIRKNGINVEVELLDWTPE